MTNTTGNKAQFGNKTLGAIIAAALLTSTAIAPAFAQTSTTTPATPAAPTTEAQPNGMAPAPKTDRSGMGDAAFLTQQSKDQVSANDYIGKSIYNADNESIGDVNDLILQENGGIVAAVVGVGGFLGIGEKNVALPIDKVTMARDAKSNEVRLTTTETADALKAAPEFKALRDMKDGTDSMTTSSTTSATPATSAPSTTPSTNGDDTNSSTAAPKQ
ncbi:PRC-barrel domain-containing protein [Neorhizobium sp. NCHU2750]|uniref:PRC-barrel domain-containing protein n=1 Tax=Neorhizobium sp. NCHU2750 TaxID=1825976 RepID=UPI000E720EAC|nr:photosystem reaction center subunit H [Neorhizobium sp. NCHU2750]